MTKDNKKALAWKLVIDIALNISAWIIIPVLVGLFLGSYLDRRFFTAPRYLLIVLGISFVISIFGLSKYVSKEAKKMEEKNKVE
ncbi:MAG: AtpZ/AtpI family protein [Patescibacteria group bacterium]|jgi:F0F1-type ATP synthase assembly protein I|nr:AtpZ/AtpI family protein [Patescibacteria group bacterium]